MSRVDGGQRFAVLGVLSDQVIYGVIAEEAVQPAHIRSVFIEQAGQERVLALCEALSELGKLLEGASAGGAATDLPLRVCIADTWLPSVSIPWHEELADGKVHSDFTLACLHDMSAHLASGDVIRLDDAPYEAPRLAFVYRRALLDVLSTFAAATHGPLLSIRPLSVMAWMAAASREQATPKVVAAVESSSMVLCRGHKRLEEVLCRPLCAEEGGGSEAVFKALSIQLERRRLRQIEWHTASGSICLDLSPWPLASGDGWEVLRLTSRGVKQAEMAQNQKLLQLFGDLASWKASHLDAITPHTKAWRPMAGLLLASLACAIYLLVHSLMSVEPGVAPQTKAAETSASRGSVATSEQDAKRLKAIQAAMASLNLPVSDVLQSLQPTKDIEVGLLSLDFSGEGQPHPAIQILAETSSAADMIRYVDFLAGRAVISSARLKRHERLQQEGGMVYRFTVEAVWKP